MRSHVAFAAAVAAISLVGGADGAAARCPQPYLPVHAVAYGSGASATEGGPDLRTDLAVSQPDLDTDGDGVTDGAEVAGDTVRITRSSGVLELTTGSPVVAAPRSLGDLDGDGRSEMALVVDGTTLIVLGSTPDGSHDALAAGVQTWPGQQPGPWVGDQDGDGIGDVAVVEPGDPIRLVSVVSGADLVAAGAGSAIEGAIDPLLTLDADLHGLVDLGERAPTLLTYHRLEDPVGGEPVGDVTVHLPDPVRLRTAGVAAPAPDVFSMAGDRGGLVTAWTTTDGRRVIVLARADRGGGTVHVWDLDAECADTSTTTATSAPRAAADIEGSTTELPRTSGDDPLLLVAAGGALVLVGALLVQRSRRTSVGGRRRPGR